MFATDESDFEKNKVPPVTKELKFDPRFDREISWIEYVMELTDMEKQRTAKEFIYAAVAAKYVCGHLLQWHGWPGPCRHREGRWSEVPGPVDAVWPTQRHRV
jgi:hypothetical protein